MNLTPTLVLRITKYMYEAQPRPKPSSINWTNKTHKQGTPDNVKAASLVPTACDVIWEQFWPWRASQVYGGMW